MDVAIPTPTRRGGALASKAPTARRDHMPARLVFVIALTTIAFIIPIVDTVEAALAGSRNAYLITTPVLVALIMAGYRHPPRGVGDAESDWILGAIFGIGGIGTLELLILRFPTISALWHLPNVQMVVWLAAASIVTFSVRHVLRLWKAWLFALVCALVLPYLLVTSAFGGTDEAAAMLAVALGTLAVVWAARFAVWRWRLAATVVNVACGAGWALLMGDTSLVLRTVVGAGAVPVLTILALNRYSRRNAKYRFPAVTAPFPHRHLWSYAVLAAAAVLVLGAQLPRSPLAVPPNAVADWAQRMNLRASAQFPFIANFIGPGTTLVRYPVAGEVGMPSAVIDVITGVNLAAMRDFRDVVWYPSAEPVNYEKQLVDGAITVQARSVHNNGDMVSTDDATNWYALSWAWDAGDYYQRVMIVVNQDARSRVYPPVPQPITLARSLIAPAKWILRQQPASTGLVEPAVVERAHTIALRVLTAGAAHGN